MGFAEACRMRSPRLLANGTVDGVQVSVCSSNCRVHSRGGASSRILSNFQGPASNTVPPPMSLHALKPQLSLHPLTVRKLELQSFVTRRSLPSRFRFEYCLRISLRFFSSATLVDLRAYRSSHNIEPRHCTSAPTQSRDLEIISFTTSTVFPSRCKAAGY